MFPNVVLTQAYGMSECLLSFLPKCDKPDNYRTAGCVAPGFKTKIVDVDSGDAVRPNVPGEIVVMGAAVMKGYFKNQTATEESIDKEGWLHSGDVGYINEKGELFVMDRIKEMIKVDGQQVAPAEIEAVLSSDPRIRDVGVVGIPNDIHGEIPCAFVVRTTANLHESDVEALIKKHISSSKWCDGIIKFVEAIPKNGSGKILRRELRNLLHG